MNLIFIINIFTTLPWAHKFVDFLVRKNFESFKIYSTIKSFYISSVSLDLSNFHDKWDWLKSFALYTIPWFVVIDETICPYGKYHGFNGKCYYLAHDVPYVYNSSLNVKQSTQYCANQRATIFTVNNIEEWGFIFNLINFFSYNISRIFEIWKTRIGFSVLFNVSNL